MKRKTPLVAGEYYHIYNRGVEKRDIFLDEKDFERFQNLLFICNDSKKLDYKTLKGKRLIEIEREKPKVAIGSYCLMKNHFHILIKGLEENSISEFLQKLSTSYAMYFNKKYERKGPLFESRFYSEHLENDNYLRYIYSYISLNPLKIIEPNWKDDGLHNKEKAFQYCSKYKYSSLQDHLGKIREKSIIMTPDEFPEYFSDPQEFKEEIFEWLNYGDF